MHAASKSSKWENLGIRGHALNASHTPMACIPRVLVDTIRPEPGQDNYCVGAVQPQFHQKARPSYPGKTSIPGPVCDGNVES